MAFYEYQIFAGLADAKGNADHAAENAAKLQAIADRVLPGYTWQDTVGRWDGFGEPSVIITYITESDDLDKVLAVCSEYKLAAAQQSVLWTVRRVCGGFV